MKLKSQFDSQIFAQDNQELAFSKKFEHWLKKNINRVKNKSDWYSTDFEKKTKAIEKWQFQLFQAGWMCVSWPKQYGGQSLPLQYEQIVADSLAKYNAPYCCNYPAIQAVGKMILDYGTEEQKKRYVRPIISGQLQCCICFTEAKHGVNFNNNETRAELKNGQYILSGKKIWSSHSPISKLAVVMALTSLNKAAEFSSTMFLVDLTKKGIQLNPYKITNDEIFYGEIVFDQVELNEEDILGHLNSGWLILSTTWMNEAHTPFDVPLRLNCKKLLKAAKKRKYISDDALDAMIHAEAIRLMSYQALKDPSSQDIYRLNSPILKIAYTECLQKIAESGKDYSEPEVNLGSIKDSNQWDYQYLSSKAESIARAPNEIHRNYLIKMFLKANK